MVRTTIVACAFWAVAAATALGQGFPAGAPELAGMAPDRLARITATMKDLVDQGRVAGTVTLVARNGKAVYHEAAGRRDLEKNLPMTTDTLFRIASMSKAVTSVAIMMLVEEGRVHLDDPVSRFIPAFAKTTVVVPPPAGTSAAAMASAAGRAPAARPITIRHLLTHTAGISYGNGNPFEAEYKAASVIGWYFADKNEPIAATIDRLATLPMDAQPGDKYVYGFNTDILGVVVEKASGQSLADFFRTRIFVPLKMTNTSFYVDPAQAERLATVYGIASAGAPIAKAPEPGMGQGHYVTGPRQSFSGGAGLVSTASDYARFLQMLLNGGALDGDAPAQPEDGRADDVEPRRIALRQRQLRLRPRLRDHRARRPFRASGVGRRVRLGRRLPHQVLGGPGREARGRVHDPVAAGRRLGRPHDAATAGLLGRRRQARRQRREGRAPARVVDRTARRRCRAASTAVR